MPAWMEPLARTIDAAKKYVVSRTLKQVDWNADLVRGAVAARRSAAGEPAGLRFGGGSLALRAEASIIGMRAATSGPRRTTLRAAAES